MVFLLFLLNVYENDKFAALRQLWFIGLIIDATKINNCWDGMNDKFFEMQLNRFKFWYEKCPSFSGIVNLR